MSGAVAAVLAWCCAAPVADGETQFGGGLAGPDARVVEVLSAIAGRDAFRWIRSPSPRVAEFGFDGVSDVRLHVPRSGTEPDLLPDDLFETYWACRNGLPAFPGAPRVWEVWNEPDFYFVRDSAADMAATLKAAWWGVKSGRPDAEVLMPSLAFRPGRYALELAVNGLASWTDGWNAHFYGWAADYPGFLAHQRAFADAIGCRKPLWITEIGHLGMPVSPVENTDAEAVQSAFHERTMIESWARGVDRHLLFLLTPHAEARNELGLTAADGRWRPALSRAVRLARALPGSRPLYRLVHRAGGDDLGLVLGRDSGDWWTVLWSPSRSGEVPLPETRPGSALPETLRLQPRWPSDWVEVRVGIEGDVALAPSQIREIELTPGSVMHLHGPPARFGLSGCRWIPWGSGDEPAPRPGRRARAALRDVPPVRDPSPVVVRFRPGPAMVADKPAQVLTLAAEGANGVGARLEFFNFDPRNQSGRWELDLPRGWLLGTSIARDPDAPGDRHLVSPVPPSPSPSSVRRSTGSAHLEGPLVIPPMSRVDVAVELKRNRDVADAPDEPGRLKARWVGDDGRVDECSVRLRTDRQPARTLYAWDWREWTPSPGQPEGWQVFRQSDRVYALEVRKPSEANRETAVHWPLPRGLREGDRFRVGVRRARGRGTPYVQVQLTTATGETWRHGELIPVGAETVRLEAGLGDFAPAIWGRHRTFLFPPLDEARWVSLTIQGVEAGDVLELESPALHR